MVDHVDPASLNPVYFDDPPPEEAGVLQDWFSSWLRLPMTGQHIVASRYLHACGTPGNTYADIGVRLGITRQRVHQIATESFRLCPLAGLLAGERERRK